MKPATPEQSADHERDYRKHDFEQIARNAGWTFDKPANEYRLNDTGNGYDAIDSPRKNWEKLCKSHKIKL